LDLKGKTLEEWLRKRQKQDFPGGKPYVLRYDTFKDYLSREVHPLVSTGAALNSLIFLNDHGPGHIETVIARASELVAAKECNLSGYEVYLLLTAIQIHDAGNILGRNDHEKQPKKWHGQFAAHLGEDSIEQRLIFQIAEAHGGKHNGDKDTIAQLPTSIPILGKQLRPRLIAAILRFADELADDRTRAARFAMDQSAIPNSSKLYHKYSQALHSVLVDVRGATVDLHYEIFYPDALDKLPKNGHSVYLLDEIIERTLKMHRERVYCARFMRPYINLETVNVNMSVYRDVPPETAGGGDIVKITYRLEDHGYPETPRHIWEVCPDKKNWHGGAPLSGEALVALLEQSGQP